MLKHCLMGTLTLLFMINACDEDVTGSKVEEKTPITSTGAQSSFGNFIVDLVAPKDTTPGQTAILGKIYDGPTLSPQILEEKDANGSCKLIIPRKPFCETRCEDGICVEDDSCGLHPAAIDVGAVTVNGLQTQGGQSNFSIDPIARNYQLSGGLTLKYPAFAEGDSISVTAVGNGAVAAFTVAARGISPLNVITQEIVLKDGQPIQLEWTPAGIADISRIEVEVNITPHGGNIGKIVCDAPDTGSLEIAAELVTQLKALGFSGWPRIDITRKATGTNATAKVNLIIQSLVRIDVEIPGLVSCSRDEVCPSGQICPTNRLCP